MTMSKSRHRNSRKNASNKRQKTRLVGYSPLAYVASLGGLTLVDSTQGNGQKPKKQRVNTAVYVTSIPLDADFEEIRYVFSKCGVIAEEIDSGRPRIKMYMDDDGKFKGEALVVFFRPESVNLAIQMLDDSDFRLGVTGPQGPMRVQPADFSYKSQQEAPTKTSAKDKRKIIQRTQRLNKYETYKYEWSFGRRDLLMWWNSKLADWDDDEPSALPETNSKFEKVVILKHMFTLKELDVWIFFLSCFPPVSCLHLLTMPLG